MQERDLRWRLGCMGRGGRVSRRAFSNVATRCTPFSDSSRVPLFFLMCSYAGAPAKERETVQLPSRWVCPTASGPRGVGRPLTKASSLTATGRPSTARGPPPAGVRRSTVAAVAAAAAAVASMTRGRSRRWWCHRVFCPGAVPEHPRGGGRGCARGGSGGSAGRATMGSLGGGEEGVCGRASTTGRSPANEAHCRDGLCPQRRCVSSRASCPAGGWMHHSGEEGPQLQLWWWGGLR